MADVHVNSFIADVEVEILDAHGPVRLEHPFQTAADGVTGTEVVVAAAAERESARTDLIVDHPSLII